MANELLNKDFVQLITQHQGIIHKVCNIYCAHATDREDLFQEILLQIWRAYPSFKGQSKISTWMYRIALNTAISSFRKQKRRPTEEQLDSRIFQLAEEQKDEEFEEKLGVLYQAIQQLNKVEKAMVMLYLEEYSYQQIADIMGISESNVGVKLHRIKAKLKKIVTTLYDRVR